MNVPFCKSNFIPYRWIVEQKQDKVSKWEEKVKELKQQRKWRNDKSLKFEASTKSCKRILIKNLIINVNHKNIFRVISSSCVYLRWIWGNKFYFREFMLIDFSYEILNFASNAQSLHQCHFLLKIQFNFRELFAESFYKHNKRLDRHE